MQFLMILVACIFLILPAIAYTKVGFDECYYSRTPLDHSMLVHNESDAYLQLFKRLYNENFLQDCQHSKNSTADLKKAKIPKKIHQFWLGDGHSAVYTKIYAQTCQEINPEWEYHLWSMEVIEHEINHNKQLLQFFKDNLWVTSIKDYVELLVLNTFGGIFIDNDYVCTQPFQELSEKYSFFQSLEPPFVLSQIPATSSAIMGSVKNGYIINNLLKMFENYYLKDEVMLDINQYCPDLDKNQSQNPILSQLTSAQNIMNICSQDYDKHCRDIVLFPPCYFLSPFIPKDEFLHYARSKYTGLEQFIVYILKYALYRDQTNENEETSYQRLFKKVVATFLPAYFEDYQFDQPWELNIAYRDWDENLNGIFLMNEVTQFVQNNM